MAQRAQPVRGMRDIVPPQAELRRRVANRILDVYAAYGFDVIETPALEDLDVLVGSGGGENEKLIFKVLRRGARLDEEVARGGELADMALRFDLTVPLARFVANHLHELPMPFKAAHVAPVWRAERPQQGRYREFVQCDIDIVGEASVAAEVELCTATMDALGKIGLVGCTLRLNDRRLLRWTVEHFLGPSGDPAPVYIALDKLGKVGEDRVAAELVELGHSQGRVERLLAQLAAGEVTGPDDVQAEVQRTLACLEEQGCAARFDATLVRGLGYYTGQIFEVSHPSIGYSLAGGGRYDGMTARFGAPPLPMCGISIGFDRVTELADASMFAAGQQRVAVLCASEEELLKALAVAKAKRASDPSRAYSVLRRARNVRKQHDDLTRMGFAELLDGKAFASAPPT